MKLRTLLGLGVGYAIGSQFGPDKIQRLISDVVSQLSPEQATATSEPSGQSDVSWPSTEFDLTNTGTES